MEVERARSSTARGPFVQLDNDEDDVLTTKTNKERHDGNKKEKK
jgi:hypothetical protein